MKAKIALIAALPAALSLAACGDASNEVDGTDTTSMEPAAVEPMPTGMTEPMATEETDTMTETPAPEATETPM